MRDSYDRVLKPVGQFFGFTKLLSIVFLILLYLCGRGWFKCDIDVIKRDLASLGLLSPQPHLYSASANERVYGTANTIIHHEVRPGETLPLIARYYNISWRKLAEDNHISDYSYLKSGTILYIRR